MIGAKTFSTTDGCDTAIVIQHHLTKIFKKKLKIQILTDSEELFTLVMRNAYTTEGRLMIDIKGTGEA